MTYFPTPYPGEWWYSVLCRYYVRSGFSNHATVLHELYGKRCLIDGRLFPGGSCHAVISNLPQAVTYGSGKKAKWKCPQCGYRWERVIGRMGKNPYCPHCGTKYKHQEPAS